VIFKGLGMIVLMLIVTGVIIGIAFSQIELLNPNLASERARRISVETAALQARNAYEQQRQQIALERQRALAQKELEWRERWAETAEIAVSFLVLALTFAVAVTGLSGAAYLICLGIVRLREAAVPRQQPPSPGAKVIPLPVRSTATGSRPNEARPTPKLG
jgi:hypothetical protein